MPLRRGRGPDRRRASALRIHLGEIDEARPDRLVVRPHQRIGALQIDVILDQHQRPRPELGPQRARRVGQQQRPAADRLQRAHQRVERRGADALVEMRPPRQAGDRHAAEAAEHQPPGMALHARPRKARQVVVGDRRPARRSARRSHRARSPGRSRPGAAGRRRARRITAAASSAGRGRGAAQVDRPERHGQQRRPASSSRAARPARQDAPGSPGARTRPAAGGSRRRACKGLASADQGELGDRPLAGRHHHPDRVGLGALALRIGGVLDVAAGEHLPAAPEDGRADGKARIGRVGALARGRRGRDQLVADLTGAARRPPVPSRASDPRAKGQMRRQIAATGGSFALGRPSALDAARAAVRSCA